MRMRGRKGRCNATFKPLFLSPTFYFVEGQHFYLLFPHHYGFMPISTADSLMSDLLVSAHLRMSQGMPMATMDKRQLSPYYPCKWHLHNRSGHQGIDWHIWQVWQLPDHYQCIICIISLIFGYQTVIQGLSSVSPRHFSWWCGYCLAFSSAYTW